MNKSDPRMRDSSLERKVHRDRDGKIKNLSSAERQLLESLSAGAPLSRVLNAICGALDCQIGNVVSFIVLPADDESELAGIAMNAVLFGLDTFCSEGLVAENDELLGSLEMYCSAPRCPTLVEFQLIARAKWMAATAIELDDEADFPDVNCSPGNQATFARVLEWPVSKTNSADAQIPAPIGD